jgi:hypothetical protein
MTKVKITLRVVERKDTGETFIVPSDAEIAESKRLEIAGLDQQIAARKAATESPAQKRAIEMLDEAKHEIDARYARWEADVQAALPEARELTFDLTRPQFGEQRRAYGAAQKLDYDNAQAILDSSEYQYQLLVSAVGNEDEVSKLDPVVAQELSRRVYRMVHPDGKRLPFVAGPPSNS